MERVRGIGGIFFKSPDKARLAGWYRDHLGVDLLEWGGAVFESSNEATDSSPGVTVWSVFDAGSDYFGKPDAQFLINYRVDDLDAMLRQLREAGVQVDDKVEESEQGRFGWAHDLDGNRFELWEPPAAPAADG